MEYRTLINTSSNTATNGSFGAYLISQCLVYSFPNFMTVHIRSKIEI